MSKIALLAAVSATIVLGACSKKAPDPQPMSAPVYVEPTSTKKY